MDSGDTPYAGGYVPGDMVTVIDGTFIGMAGAVVGPEEVRLLRSQSGGQDSLIDRPPGMVWVQG
jgi:hypothetical protein